MTGPGRYLPLPFATFETFCQAEWIGREAEWFGALTVLHWTLSFAAGNKSTRILILAPDSRHYQANLDASTTGLQTITMESGAGNALQVDSTPADGVDTALAELAHRSPSSIDMLLAVGTFQGPLGIASDASLLRACHRLLRTGGHLIAVLSVQDQLGNPDLARSLRVLDAARAAGFEELQIVGCQGIAGYLTEAFWRKLRAQGEAAFNTVVNGLAQINDDPSAQWMSPDILYIGIKR